MSSNNFGYDDSESNYAEDLVSFRKEILERKDRISKSFKKISQGDIRHGSIRSVIGPLTDSISDVKDRESEVLVSASNALLYVTMNRDTELAAEVSEMTDDNKNQLSNFLMDLIVEYGEELERIRYRITQGERWWSYVESDFIVTGESINVEHKVEIDRSDVVTFQSAPSSEWNLIRHLIRTQADFFDQAGEDAGVGALDPRLLADCIVMLEQIKDIAENNGVEIPVEENE
ncbi:hypothetical protein [Halobaculum sp. EA56]|uniref:hypothetical protein n=1 Tax=Halobaculum sp. EA56 TaxID=3421648 RepID=UPI003EB78FCB